MDYSSQKERDTTKISLLTTKSRRNTGKIIVVQDGAIKKISQKESFFTAESISIDCSQAHTALQSLAEILKNLTAKNAIMLSTPKELAVDNYSIVPEKALPNHPGSIARLKRNFWPSRFLCLDVDNLPEHLKNASREAIVQSIVAIIPELAGVASLFVPSSTARVQWNGAPIYSGGFRGHWYVVLDHEYSPTDIDRVRDSFVSRLEDSSLGFTLTSKNGGTLNRTIIDPSPLNTGGLIYAGAPTVQGEGLALTQWHCVAVEGGFLTPYLPPEDAIKRRTRAAAKEKAEGVSPDNKRQNKGGNRFQKTDWESLQSTTIIRVGEKDFTCEDLLSLGHRMEGIRCAPPFRASTSGNSGIIHVHNDCTMLSIHDFGTGTTFFYSKEKNKKDIDSRIGRIISNGYLNTYDINDINRLGNTFDIPNIGEISLAQFQKIKDENKKNKSLTSSYQVKNVDEIFLAVKECLESTTKPLLVLVKAPHGTGKTQGLIKPLSQLSMFSKYGRVAIAPYRSLCASLSKILGFSNYQKLNEFYRKDRVVCANSIENRNVAAAMDCADFLAIDEIECVTRDLLTQKSTHGKDAFNRFKFLIGKIRNARLTIGVDADLSQQTINRLEKESKVDTLVFEIKETPIQKIFNVVNIEELINRISLDVAENKNVLITSDSALQVAGLFNELKNKTNKILAIHSKKGIETVGNPSVQAFLDNPQIEHKNYQIVIYSPTISSGLSIVPENGKNHFDSFYAIYNGIVTPDSFVQQLSRDRGQKEIYLSLNVQHKNFPIFENDIVKGRLALFNENNIPLEKGNAYDKYVLENEVAHNNVMNKPDKFLLATLEFYGHHVIGNKIKDDAFWDEIKKLKSELDKLENNPQSEENDGKIETKRFQIYSCLNNRPRKEWKKIVRQAKEHVKNLIVSNISNLQNDNTSLMDALEIKKTIRRITQKEHSLMFYANMIKSFFQVSDKNEEIGRDDWLDKNTIANTLFKYIPGKMNDLHYLIDIYNEGKINRAIYLLKDVIEYGKKLDDNFLIESDKFDIKNETTISLRNFRTTKIKSILKCLSIMGYDIKNLANSLKNDEIHGTDIKKIFDYLKGTNYGDILQYEGLFNFRLKEVKRPWQWSTSFFSRLGLSINEIKKTESGRIYKINLDDRFKSDYILNGKHSRYIKPGLALMLKIIDSKFYEKPIPFLEHVFQINEKVFSEVMPDVFHFITEKIKK